MTAIARCDAPYRPAPPIVARCDAPYRVAVPIIARSVAPYRAAAHVLARCDAPYRVAVPIIARCAAPYRTSTPALARCEAPYRAGDPAPVLARCEAPYRANDIALARCEAPYRCAEAEADSDAVYCTINGVAVDPVRISITDSRQQSVISAELELATEAEWLLCTRHAGVVLTLWGYEYRLLVDSRSRSESFGETGWNVQLASPAILLELPWAESIEGELSGLASDLARLLAAGAGLELDWRAVDWRIGPGIWIVTPSAPLVLLQTLATACGAILRSLPDGNLIVEPRYLVSPPDWGTADPAARITTMNEVITLAASGEQKDGIDCVTVSDSGQSANTLRIEEDSERRSGDTTEALVYQTPWRDDFTLTHRGDPARAGIVPLGVEEREVQDEEIIIQNGEGRAQFPVYAVLDAEYNKRNLGTPTYSEDGTIKTAVQDESIMILRYRTRCRRYRVREADLRDLLLVAEDSA